MEWERYIHFMRALRANLLRAQNALIRLGYRFDEVAVTEPQADRVNTIDLIESHGLVLPGALRAFYEVFGSIEFQGSSPSDWTGCEYPNPLSVVPLDLQFWRSELDSWREGGEQYFTPQFSGDDIHKAGFSGAGYHFVFDGNDDPSLIAPGLPDRFISYLALCNEWGGFPGLRLCPNHSWPLAEIKAGFIVLP